VFKVKDRCNGHSLSSAFSNYKLVKLDVIILGQKTTAYKILAGKRTPA
jgi:hypothetical protein